MKRASHIELTEKEFKREKRKQFKEVMKAIEDSELMTGSAYLPPEAYRTLSEAIDLMQRARLHCRKWWEDC